MELSPAQPRPRRSRASMGEPSPSATVSPEAKQQAVGGQPVPPQAGRLRRVVNNALNRGRSTGQELRPRSPKKRASREKSTSSNSPGDPRTPAAKQQNLEESPIKQVAVGIAMGARSLAAGVAALGARALGGGASPMVADGMAARSRVLSPSQVLPLSRKTRRTARRRHRRRSCSRACESSSTRRTPTRGRRHPPPPSR